MFTGLVEEIGTVRSIGESDGARTMEILASRCLSDLRIDHSIAVDGCCQTVVALQEDSFYVTAVPETLRKTTLGGFEEGRPVNLERAVRMDQRFGGHFVQGHIDTTTELIGIERDGESILMTFALPDPWRPYLIPTGSIAINGVSLTVARLRDHDFTVALIPHTLSMTTLGSLAERDQVNIEFDMLGKHVVQAMAARTGESAD